MYQRPVWAEIDLDAISANVSTLRRLLTPPTEFMAVIKADAYGHGAVEVAKALLKAGVGRLGVALVEEGVALREAGIGAPIQVLSPLPVDGADLAVEKELISTIVTKREAEALDRTATRGRKRHKVQVKVDTGMNRLGIFPEEVADFLGFLQSLDHLEVEGIFTHFAVADEADNPYTQTQLERFLRLTEELKVKSLMPLQRHAANSAAAIFFPQTHLDMVRIGIAVYGLHPSEATKSAVELKPAFSWKARVAQVKTLGAGEGVSYGLTYRAPQATKLAVIPVGYADGYSRLFSNKSQVLIAGRRAPVVGRVCMDLIMVDVGRAGVVEPGAEVVLLGPQGNEEITADQLAQILGTINYEIVCKVSSRVPRVFVGGQA